MSKFGKQEATSGDKKKRWHSLPQHGLYIVLAALIVSVLLHMGSAVNILVLQDNFGRSTLNIAKKPPVKIKIVQIPRKNTVKPKKILETKLEETEKPDKATHLGQQDHKAKQKTKLKENALSDNRADPRALGQKIRKMAEERRKRPESSQGKLRFQRQPRNPYEAMLPIGNDDLQGQFKAGYQEYVDEKIAEGDRIDIDTSKYRYIGYFTSMRKAISLVWNYPSEAVRKGLKGEVGLEFMIGKEGHASRIKVIKTSGYDILDSAIVQAIKLASPFAPLPKGFGKEQIVITGTFRYVLGSYSYGAH